MENVPDLIPDLPVDHIQCWSKSDGLAKVLLVVQLLYFSISCAARLAQHLPLSLLEVWTLAHALGAILVYVAWWRKPLDISEPTMIAVERARELAAYLQVVGMPLLPRAAGVDNHYGSPETTYLEIKPCRPSEPNKALHSGQGTIVTLPGQTIQLEEYSFAIRSPSLDYETNLVFDEAHRPWYARDREPNGAFLLNQTDVLRWQLAARAATRLGGSWQPQNAVIYTKAGGLETFDVVPAFGSSFRPTIGAIVVPIMTVYALPHFLGWNATFPTPAECTLWRFASCMVAVLPTVFYACFVCKLAGRQVQGGRPFIHALWQAILATTGTLFWAAIVLYVLANGYLLVESLRQLRHLPSRAYLLPDLSVYLPHIT